jgi:homogentisate 1,2-dioxygenase
MLDRMAAGELPDKPHTALRDAHGTLRYEHCLTRDGFDGPFSILYHLHRPHALIAREPTHAAIPTLIPAPGADRQLTAAESSLRRRHFRTGLLRVGAALLDARTALLENADLTLSVCKPSVPEPVYFVNADADELFFVREGRGVVRSAFGDLAFGP